METTPSVKAIPTSLGALHSNVGLARPILGALLPWPGRLLPNMGRSTPACASSTSQRGNSIMCWGVQHASVRNTICERGTSSATPRGFQAPQDRKPCFGKANLRQPRPGFGTANLRDRKPGFRTSNLSHQKPGFGRGKFRKIRTEGTHLGELRVHIWRH